MEVRRLAIVLLLLSVPVLAAGAAAAPARDRAPTSQPARWGDQGDGTYANPILPADYSDIDAIRVGDDYYAISSTFQYSPGMIVLRSCDLVNWTIAGHAIDDVFRISPAMNWDRMDRYGRGVWAGAIRHHAGKFWIYFGTPDEGYFVTTARDAGGPWEPARPVLREKGWDDCCPFWDDDGQGYLVGTNFADGYKIHLFKLSADGGSVDRSSDRVLYSSKGSEANKLYKIDGTYYHYFSEVRREGRVPMMRRAKRLDGPWETKQIGHVDRRIDKEPNQGGLVDTPAGAWWFLTHQGTGDWEGRAMCLLPVTWVEGWPILGRPRNDGIGEIVWSARKPILGAAAMLPQTSDEFDDIQLSPQWEWNHQPREGKWSLAVRPGYLRLAAFPPLKQGDLFTAGNTLTQRCWRAEDCQATVKLDISAMVDGQFAGLAHYAKTWCAVGVRQTGSERRIVRVKNGKETVGLAVTGADVWLRSTWGLDGVSHFAFSFDGKSFPPVDGDYPLTWGHYRGDRIAIFTFNDEGERGQIDVDWFHLDFNRPPGVGPMGEDAGR